MINSTMTGGTLVSSEADGGQRVDGWRILLMSSRCQLISNEIHNAAVKNCDIWCWLKTTFLKALLVFINLLLFSRLELTESRSSENVCKQLKLFQVSFKWLKVTRVDWDESPQSDWNQLKLTQVDWKVTETNWNQLKLTETDSSRLNKISKIKKKVWTTCTLW